ncbi:IclR family transcriptional regulator, partial [Candidatus Neomarinimicrobiota bacterium]
ARGLVSSSDLVSVARPYMVKLLDTFGETVNLGKLVGDDIIFLHIEETAHQFRYVDNVGDRASLHSTAIGKAICAFRPDADLGKMLTDYEFTRFTRHSITSLEDFNQQMLNVREQGFALDNEEGTPGVVCIAVPVFDESYRSNSAISISMPKIRSNRKLVREIQEELPKIGVQMSIDMGVTDIRKCFNY